MSVQFVLSYLTEALLLKRRLGEIFSCRLTFLQVSSRKRQKLVAVRR